MSDYFGYSRDHKANEIISSDTAAISIGGDQFSIVQNYQASYQHRVEPRYELGSSDLFWVNGRPTGQVQISKLVGEDGLLRRFDGGEAACGDLKNLSIDLDGGSCDQSGGGLSFAGAKLQQVSAQAQAGGLEISESATFMIAEMTKG